MSPSPHFKGKVNTSGIMRDVIIAMLPAMFAAFLFFGINAAHVIMVAVTVCVLCEYIMQKFVLKSARLSIMDGSAVVTGILLAFNLPSNCPLWMVAVGAVVAIAIAKMSFGGLGQNVFNPALVGRVFLLASFPVQMTSWPVPKKWFDFGGSNIIEGASETVANASEAFDIITGATVLGVVKETIIAGGTATDIAEKTPDYMIMFVGQMGGSLGEVSALAIILGGLYLLYRRVISWHIPVVYIATVAVMTGCFWLYDDAHYMHPLAHILSGGLMLGAIFMATDMVTSPMTKKGQVVFAIGCGVLTVLIRLFGGYPEGVSFAILLMNACVPLIDNVFTNRVYGVGVGK
ncbi:MAG: RnfABCDGE type electron transport complex subunit D [Alphaproteobacteria bacterium]|nr:RnfABCDGE type electron transport complex subunit D [Alphaproteobacteria bacterium]